MDRLVLVVSRERDDVYESLKDVLASETDLAVVLDRRVMERRQQSLPAAPERRHLERRAGDHAPTHS